MFTLEFYETNRGYSDVREFIDELERKAEANKDAITKAIQEFEDWKGRRS